MPSRCPPRAKRWRHSKVCKPNIMSIFNTISQQGITCIFTSTSSCVSPFWDRIPPRYNHLKWEPQPPSTTIRNTVPSPPPPNAPKPTIPTLHPHRFLHQVTDITIFHDFETSSFFHCLLGKIASTFQKGVCFFSFQVFGGKTNNTSLKSPDL